FDEHRQSPPGETLIIPLGKPLLQFREPPRAVLLDVAGNLIGHCRRGRSLPRTERELMDLHEARGLACGQCFVKLRVRLAGEADDDIGGKCRVFHPVTNKIELFEIAADAIAALHPREDRVRAALQTKMKMRAQPLAISNGGDEVRPDFGRFETRQSQSPIAGNAVELPDEMPQPKRFAARSPARRLDAVVAE